MDTGTELQVEWVVYCENFVMIGLTADAGDNFKYRTLYMEMRGIYC
jgi:hypothetical protein